uniref:Uncharacterized protein n=1 Tax=Arundo donax TaxID=35708 RepID=A0A0A9E2J1_ARUDO
MIKQCSSVISVTRSNNCDTIIFSSLKLTYDMAMFHQNEIYRADNSKFMKKCSYQSGSKFLMLAKLDRGCALKSVK